MIQLVDALGLGRFAVIGSSVGGTDAAACAYRIPKRLAATALASGAGEFGAPGAMDGAAKQLKPVFNIALRLPWQFTWWLTMGPMGMMAKKGPDKIVQITVDSFPPSDRGPMLETPGMLDMIRAAYVEMFRQGARGPALDLALVAKPWGFRMADIQVPVILWHGEDDTNVLLATVRRHAAELQDCEAHFVPGIGHALTFSHWREILASVVSAARG